MNHRIMLTVPAAAFLLLGLLIASSWDGLPAKAQEADLVPVKIIPKMQERQKNNIDNESYQQTPVYGTRTTITSDQPDPSKPGELIRVYVRVQSSFGTPFGTVNVYTNPRSSSCSISSYPFISSCTLRIPLPGSYVITAAYRGNIYFLPSSDTESHTVVPPRIFLTPPTQSGDGPPGAVIEYEIQLRNYTSQTDSYNLTLGAHSWDTTLSDSQIGPVGPSGSLPFNLSVAIPPDAVWYDTDSVVITAASVTNPTEYYATARVTTRAYVPPQISVAPTSFSSTQYPNQTDSQSLNISNGDGVPLTFDINTNSSDWILVNPMNGTIPAGDSVSIQLTFDSSGLQPSVYSKNLSITSNDPAHPNVTLPVAMTVQPTSSMGWVEGTVTDLRTGEPLVASIVAAGQPYTVSSSQPGGAYKLWLEPGNYELQASTSGYITQSQMVQIQAQQGTTQNITLLLDAPWITYSPEGLSVTQFAGETTSQAFIVTNSGSAALSYRFLEKNDILSFDIASTELYGYTVPEAWLRIIGLSENTTVEVINLDTGLPISNNPDLDRYEIWDVYPEEGTHYKVTATQPVVGYASDLDGFGHMTFIPSIDSGPVGKEFIFYLHWGDTIGDYCYVIGIENAQVEIYDPSGALIASNQLHAGEFWRLTIPNGVYRIVSSGLIEIEIFAEDSYTTVPSIAGSSTGYLFYFATHFQETGAFAVFAHDDTQINVYDLEAGTVLFTHALERGQYWWQTDVNSKKLRLESTGLVEVWAGATQGGTAIEYLGDDLSFTTGNGGLEFYIHSLLDGSIFFAPFDDTSINVDGTIYELNKDEYLHLGGCCFFRHIQSTRPILIQTLGGDWEWNNTGTYLGGVVPGGGGLPAWLSTSPLTGTLQSGQNQTIDITFDATGLQPGVYTTTLYITSNDPFNSLVSIPVRMVVLGEENFKLYMPLVH